MEHYHVSEKDAHDGFVWHPDTLFQPNEISFGTSFFCRKYSQEHSFLRPYTGKICLLTITEEILNRKLHFLCSVCLSKSMAKNLFKFNTTTVKQSSFIHLIIALT